MAEELGDYSPPPMFEMSEKTLDIPPKIRTASIAFPLEMKLKEKDGKPIPPLPPRRPEKFHASESFIKQALNNLPPSAAAAADIIPPAPPKAHFSENEQLENLLRNPSAAEILKQLE